MSHDQQRVCLFFLLVHQASWAWCRSCWVLLTKVPRLPITKSICSNTHVGAAALNSLMMHLCCSFVSASFTSRKPFCFARPDCNYVDVLISVSLLILIKLHPAFLCVNLLVCSFCWSSALSYFTFLQQRVKERCKDMYTYICSLRFFIDVVSAPDDPYMCW